MPLMAWIGWRMEQASCPMPTRSTLPASKPTNSFFPLLTKAPFNVCFSLLLHLSSFVSAFSSLHLPGTYLIDTVSSFVNGNTLYQFSGAYGDATLSKYALPLTNPVTAIASVELPNQVQGIPAVLSVKDGFAIVLCSRCILFFFFFFCLWFFYIFIYSIHSLCHSTFFDSCKI